MIRIKNGYAEPEQQSLVNGIFTGTTWRGFQDVKNVGEDVKWKHGNSIEEVEQLINSQDDEYEDDANEQNDPKNPWMPFENVFKQIGSHVKFEILMMDNSIKLALYDDNEDRTALMVQGTGGMFWRNMAFRPDSTPTKWRKIP